MSEYDELEKTELIDDSPAPESEQSPPQKPNFYEDLTPEDRQLKMIDRMKLRNKIMRYRELFPKYLEHFEFDLETMSESEMEILIEEMSVAVNTRNSSGLTKMIYFESVKIAEVGGSLVGLQINGLSEALQQNAAIHDVLNEISLKYENDMYMAPEIRLAYVTLTTALSLHKLNSSQNTISNFLNKPIKKNDLGEFDDL